jgi:hypothetical protein
MFGVFFQLLNFSARYFDESTFWKGLLWATMWITYLVDVAHRVDNSLSVAAKTPTALRNMANPRSFWRSWWSTKEEGAYGWMLNTDNKINRRHLLHWRCGLRIDLRRENSAFAALC